jgi:hypothetical protein
MLVLELNMLLDQSRRPVSWDRCACHIHLGHGLRHWNGS